MYLKDVVTDTESAIWYLREEARTNYIIVMGGWKALSNNSLSDVAGLIQGAGILGYEVIIVDVFVPDTSDEVSYGFLVCSRGHYFSDSCVRDAVNFMRVYGIDEALVWNSDDQSLTKYTIDNESSDISSIHKDFDTFDPMTAISVLSDYRDSPVVKSVKPYQSELDGTKVPLYRISNYRKKIFGEWY